VRYYCQLFGRSRQSYYEQIKQQEEQDMASAMVLRLVREIRQELPRAGVPKLQVLLKDSLTEHGIKMGRDALYHLLGQHGLLIRQRKRRPYTTDSNHRYRKYPNLIREIKYLTHPGQLWVSDITYIRHSKGFCYLSIVTDAYSHRIIGYCLHPTLHRTGPINALMMASRSKRQSTLIHHSDRGSQYCCDEHVKMLEHYNIRISMTENGDPYENAIAERINGILKNDFELHKTFSGFAEAEKAVQSAVDRYNRIRPHASCDNLTPDQAHQGNGVLRKRWKTKAEHEKMIT
jgi:transposase InsO family protein